MVLTEREIVQTIEVGVSFYAIFSIIRYIISYCNKKWISYTLNLCNNIAFSVAMLPSLLVIGYYVVSDKHMLSANILLTLFQTNYEEVVSYLVEQNIVVWILSVLAIIIIMTFFIYLFSKIKRNSDNFKMLTCNIILMTYMVISVFPKLSSSFVIGMIERVSDTLQEYKEYNNISAARAKRISHLHSVIKYNEQPQLHVLVMGESTVRHHLSAFGYSRQTTPWLDKLIEQNKNVVLYPKAYSNNIQTVMSVQFALTSQNQYNNSVLTDAYSITEVASAAGYDTYWISNQMHHKSYDTPINTIGNGADHQVYINEFWGNKLLTMYYDEKLADYFPEIKENSKTFIIFHLMGCHNVYNDRYPESYEFFKDGNDDRVNAYDNCVRYNDYVLSLLYEKAVQNPNFMSFTFLSDHGEDPDKGLTHDYSKFTWNMAHIPFFNIFSQKFAEQNTEIINTLKNNSGKYWTSDLLYNEMLHILGISNAPDENEYFDISSVYYNMPYDKLTIIEGQRYIKDDNDK
ncbi:MAG: phosphoethanolamine transferase [Alphaproteobacteria bacterium]|nr:phosphoethanolamine transferase [Alphaproteobacteria bacterium]